MSYTVHQIADLEVLHKQVAYVTCSGADRIITYAFREGHWQWRRETPEVGQWQVVLNPEGLAEYLRKWTQAGPDHGHGQAGWVKKYKSRERSVIFSICCVCGDHTLALGITRLNGLVSHGYCEPCLAKLEKEIWKDKEEQQKKNLAVKKKHKVY
jgi:hypothetical protein